jgi:hypothetical protein
VITSLIECARAHNLKRVVVVFGSGVSVEDAGKVVQDLESAGFGVESRMDVCLPRDTAVAFGRDVGLGPRSRWGDLR